jgi:hypothetical protein
MKGKNMKLPKFYNPFKAHIVQIQNGRYLVRRFRLLYWEYRDNGKVIVYDKDEDNWWVTFEYAKRWCVVDTLEEAKVLRDKTKIRKFKVIHG